MLLVIFGEETMAYFKPGEAYSEMLSLIDGYLRMRMSSDIVAEHHTL